MMCLLPSREVICGWSGSVASNTEVQDLMCSVLEYGPRALLHCVGFLRRMSSSQLFYGKHPNASFRAQLST